MSPLDFSGAETGQKRLESVAAAKQSPTELKSKLAEYRETYVSEVNLQKSSLNTALSSLKSEAAKQFLASAAQELGGSVVALAEEGEKLQKTGQSTPDSSQSDQQTETEKKLDFATLSSLKLAVKTGINTQKAELEQHRTFERYQDFFSRESTADQTLNNSSTLANLPNNLAIKTARQTALNNLGAQLAVSAAIINQYPSLATDFANLTANVQGLKSSLATDLSEGQKALDLQSDLSKKQKNLQTINKDLASKKTLTKEEYQQYLSHLSECEPNPFTFAELGLVGPRITADLEKQYTKPLQELLEKLHVQVEARKPNDVPATEIDADHENRLTIAKIKSALPRFEALSQSLEKEFTASKTNPEKWLSRADYDQWDGRLTAQLDTLNQLRAQLHNSESEAATRDLISRLDPIQQRLEQLKTKAQAERLEPIKAKEKIVLDQKIKEMVGRLTTEWQNQSQKEASLHLADLLQGLKEDSPEFKNKKAEQDALFTFLLSFEAKANFLFSKPDQLEPETSQILQDLLAKSKAWQQLIMGDRALYKMRQESLKQPDQQLTVQTINAPQTYVVNGQVVRQAPSSAESTERTDTFKFSDYVEFLNPLDPANQSENEGRGWRFKKEGLPPGIKESFSQQADTISAQQKLAVQQEAGQEKQKIQKTERNGELSRQQLGEKAKDYFLAVDLMAAGKQSEAIQAYQAYLQLSASFTPEERTLHQSCLDDAQRQIEVSEKHPQFAEGMSLISAGKMAEGMAKLQEFIANINALKTPEEKLKFTQELDAAVEMLRQINGDKLKLLDELSKDFIYLQTVQTARGATSRVVNPLDFANLKEPQRTIMLPYIPAEYLTPEERTKQAAGNGGIAGPEIQDLRQSIADLKAKIGQGNPPVDFEAELKAIREKMKKYESIQPGSNEWTAPNGEKKADGPSSRLFSFFDQINSTDPKSREEGFRAIAKEFKDSEAGMRYTQKYLRQAMVTRYREFDQADGGKTRDKVRQRLITDPKVTEDIDTNAISMYRRWAAEQTPPLPGYPADPLVFQSFRSQVFDNMLDYQYEREMRKVMTDQGKAALSTAERKYQASQANQEHPRPWSQLTLQEKQQWLSGVEHHDLGQQLLSGALGDYNESMPYDEANARWYKPWTWSDYNEDDWVAFKAKATEVTVQTLATLPIGWAAGTVGRAAGLGAMRLLAGAGLSQEAIALLSEGGIMALRSESAVWQGLSTGLKARLLAGWGVGVVAEGSAMAVMNGVWEGMYTGRSELFDALDEKKYGKASVSLLESIAKTGLFRFTGALQGRVGSLASPQSALTRKIMVKAAEELSSGTAGAGIDAAFMLMHNQGSEITWEWFLQSMLQNSAQSAATHFGHTGMDLPELSSQKAKRRLEEAGFRHELERAGIRDLSSIARVTPDGTILTSSGAMVMVENPAYLPKSLRSHYDRLLQESTKPRALTQKSPLPLSTTSDQGPYRTPAEKHPASATEESSTTKPHRTDATASAEFTPATALDDSNQKKSVSATPESSDFSPATPIESDQKAPPRPAPEVSARTVSPEHLAERQQALQSDVDLLVRRDALAHDKDSSPADIAKLDAEIAAKAQAQNLTPAEFRFRIESEAQVLRRLSGLDTGEHQLNTESKVIRKPVLNEDGTPKLENGQPVYEQINLFANYASKSSAYTRDMLRTLDHEQLVREGGVKIIKIGGDELVVYHAGPNGTVQKLFIDISNMGPTNDTATNIAGSKVNLVDIYLHKVSEVVIAQSKAHQGPPSQFLDATQFNTQIAKVAESLFSLDLGTDGQPLPAAEGAQRFERLKAEWGLEGDFDTYRTDVQSMRILAEFRSDTRYLDSSFHTQPGQDFSAHISGEIQRLTGLSVPELQSLIAANPEVFRTLIDQRVPKSKKLQALQADQLMTEIAGLNPRSSEPGDLMMLYSLMARINVNILGNNPALQGLAERISAGRQESVGSPPHARVEAPRLMDAKVVSIPLPPDLAKALAALGETDPVKAHAILAAARQFAEKPLDQQKYQKTAGFAEFNIMDFVEVQNGQIHIKDNAPEFKKAVEQGERDKKIGNVVDIEDGLRTARTELESLYQKLARHELSQAEFNLQIKQMESKISELENKLARDPDTGAYSQSYLDVSPTSMFSFAKTEIDPQFRVWNSVVTELGHAGAINAKYGYQAMDKMMAGYYAALQSGINSVLPPDLQRFKIIRSGGGKFEVIFLDSRALAHLTANGLTPQSLVERIATTTGRDAINRELSSNAHALQAVASDAAVRNTQFKHNKGTPEVKVGVLTVRPETNLDSNSLSSITSANPTISARGLVGRAREQERSAKAPSH